MFESLEKHHEDILSRPVFYLRLARYAAAGGSIGALSLFAGMLGYRVFEGQSWVDAFMNAAMLLGAMGPASSPQTDAGKIFAGCYAIYCGLFFLFIAGLLFTPIAHRLLHLFHADPPESDDDHDEGNEQH
jgi:hypothetical protein